MPIYEYRCSDCGKRSSLLILSLANPPALACRHCQSPKLERIMSRFAAPKSEDARLESLADPGKLGDLDENDPSSVARMMKRMGDEMGEDFGEDIDSMMDEGAGEGVSGEGADGID